MKIKPLCAVILGIFLFAACQDSGSTDKSSKETLEKRIAEQEQTLATASLDQGQGKALDQLKNGSDSLIQLLLAYYHSYPEDPKAAVYLDKIHLCYSAAGDYLNAAHYADTLLKNYPTYPNRALVLESQGSAYDIFIQPRNTAKARYYYQLLLKENPQMDAAKRKEIGERLKTIETPFSTLIH